MANSKSKALNLTLFLLSTLTFVIAQSDVVIHDVHLLLAKNGLPPGLLPRAAGPYNITNDGLLEVDIHTYPCYVPHPSSAWRYERKVSGKLSYAKLEDVKGIQLRLPQPGFVPVVGIEATHDKVLIRLPQPDFVLLPAAEFKDIPKCVWVEDGASGVAASS